MRLLEIAAIVLAVVAGYWLITKRPRPQWFYVSPIRTSFRLGDTGVILADAMYKPSRYSYVVRGELVNTKTSTVTICPTDHISVFNKKYELSPSKEKVYELGPNESCTIKAKFINDSGTRHSMQVYIA